MTNLGVRYPEIMTGLENKLKMTIGGIRENGEIVLKGCSTIPCKNCIFHQKEEDRYNCTEKYLLWLLEESDEDVSLQDHLKNILSVDEKRT